VEHNVASDVRFGVDVSLSRGIVLLGVAATVVLALAACDMTTTTSGPSLGDEGRDVL
jgi:hypothetical protein